MKLHAHLCCFKVKRTSSVTMVEWGTAQPGRFAPESESIRPT